MNMPITEVPEYMKKTFSSMNGLTTLLLLGLSGLLDRSPQACIVQQPAREYVGPVFGCSHRLKDRIHASINH
jgi:hypothetical protein